MTNGTADEPFGSAEKRLRWEIFNEHKRLAWANIQSSTDSYDQSLLTLSSGGLGLSIAFIKDIVPFQHAVWLTCLYFSWFAFVGCILTTVISFQVSVAAQNEHIRICQEYYMDENDDAARKQGFYGTVIKWFTGFAGGCFLVALLFTALFAVKNVRRTADMASDKKSGLNYVTDGRVTVALTPVPETTGEERGRPAVEVTPVPKGQQSEPATSTKSSTSGSEVAATDQTGCKK